MQNKKEVGLDKTNTQVTVLVLIRCNAQFLWCGYQDLWGLG